LLRKTKNEIAINVVKEKATENSKTGQNTLREETRIKVKKDKRKRN
jgi:hypothetical protein